VIAENSRNARLFFCINSGRAGSEYLARLLATGAGVRGYHEAEPTMSGAFLDMVNRAPYAASFDERRIKSAAIRNILRDANAGTVYAETNHMFIKTFFDVVIEDFPHLEVIILRRELALILKSFIEMCYFTPRNKNWPKWMSRPDGATAASRCISDFDRLDHYDRVIAYLVDIEARAVRFRATYPAIKTHDVRIEALSSEAKVAKLFESLRIPPGPMTRTLSAERINQRVAVKKHFANPADLGYCRERIHRYIERAAALGIPIPDSLAVQPLAETR
jgi:hypothetical protein